jgi:Leucine-rich repeat (LRR) protein
LGCGSLVLQMSRAQKDRLEGPLPRYDSLTDLVAFAAATRVVSYIDTMKHATTSEFAQEERETSCTKNEAGEDEPRTLEDKLQGEEEKEHYIIARDTVGNVVRKRVSSETTSILLSGLSIAHVDFRVLNSLSETRKSPRKSNKSDMSTQDGSSEESVIHLLSKIPHSVENSEECSEAWKEPTSPRGWKNLPHAAEKLLSAVLAPQLREISLASNCLESIDLTPLVDCVNLESLLLNSNKLRSIDLKPLSSCTKLEKLWLHHNQLVTISLEPLRECCNLRSIYLDHNEFTHCIDLEPLTKCKLLKSLRLGSNHMKGDLDVTPLMNCSSLSVLDVSVTTRLVSRFRLKILPPALKKHEKDILWTTEEQNSTSTLSTALPGEKTTTNSLLNETSQVKARILLLGFQSSQVSMENLFSRVANLEVSSLSKIDEGRVSIALKNLHNLQYFDAVVCESSFDWIIPKLKLVHSDIPIIVVTSDVTSEAAGTSLRFGACCLITVPLGPEDCIRVQEWAEKHSHSNCELRVASTNTLKQPCYRQIMEDRMEEQLVGLLKANATIDEESHFELVQQLSREEIADNRKELKSIEEIFAMKSTSLSDSTYRQVAVSCGLPSCAYRLLHDAVQREEKRIDCGAFGRFWKTHFLHRDCEERLFYLLCPFGKTLTCKRPLKILVEDLLKRRLLRRVSSNAVQAQLVDCALECILYGIVGTFELSGISMKDVKREKLCHALILAEQGSFKKPLEFLRPEKFDVLRKDFKIASQGHYLSSIGANVVGLDDFLRFNHERGWLTGKGALAFFKILLFLKSTQGRELAQGNKDEEWLFLSDFARFYCAMSDMSSASAAKLLFLVLDTDMDGKVGFEDFMTFYKDKARIYAREGLVLADSRVVWRHFLDMCGVLSWKNEEYGGCLCLGDLLRLERKQRCFLLKAMLWRDDGVSLVDIKASLVPTQVAPDAGVET